MQTRAHVENPDSVTLTIIIDLSVWELRKVLEEMNQITHAEATSFWIFKGHLERLLNRIDTAVFSHEREEKRETGNQDAPSALAAVPSAAPK